MQIVKNIVLRLDLNSVPYFTNMPSPQTENIAEDIASGTLLYTLTSQDNDPGATLVYSMNVDPVSETSKFSFSTNSKCNESWFRQIKHVCCYLPSLGKDNIATNDANKTMFWIYQIKSLVNN